MIFPKIFASIKDTAPNRSARESWESQLSDALSTRSPRLLVVDTSWPEVAGNFGNFERANSARFGTFWPNWAFVPKMSKSPGHFRPTYINNQEPWGHRWQCVGKLRPSAFHRTSIHVSIFHAREYFWENHQRANLARFGQFWPKFSCGVQNFEISRPTFISNQVSCGHRWRCVGKLRASSFQNWGVLVCESEI